MNITKIFISLTIFVQICFAKEKPEATIHEHNVIECKILDMKGSILKNIGTSRCIFLPDGQVIAGSHDKLRFFNPDMTKKWEKKITTHHQLNLSLDEKHILVMSSSVHKFKNINTRFDSFIVYDFSGNIIKQTDFFDHSAELLKRTTADRKQLYKIDESMKKHAPGAEMEFSHANSFYEIDENQSSDKLQAFKKGNYVININLLGLVIVMDSDLKTILWSMPQYADKNLIPNWHDVQIMESGSLLIFNNNSYVENKKNGSTIDEINPVTQKKTVLYKDSGPTPFYSEHSGGIQILSNGNFLLNTVTPHGKALEVDAKSKKVIWSLDNPEIDPTTKKPEIFQQIRRLNLKSFLEKNTGF